MEKEEAVIPDFSWPVAGFSQIGFLNGGEVMRPLDAFLIGVIVLAGILIVVNLV